jgi:PAS domain S-box-containing protein
VFSPNTIPRALDDVSTPDFLRGGGEMGALMRVHDWSHSSLGYPRTWPQPLRTAVRLLLNTGHPMYIWWGEDGACLYNDAYRRSIGPERHPGSLGRPAREVWDEIWDIIGPQIEQVMSGRGATWNENQLVPITRNGRREDVYWTYSYGPIDDETAPNGIGGVLVVCTETTQQVLSEQRLAAQAERQRRLFDRAPGFIAVLRGPEHVFEFVNEAYVRLVNGRNVTGRTVREALPEIRGQGFFELLDQVYLTGKRFVAEHVPVRLQCSPDGAVQERFLDFIYEPITSETGQVSGIFVEGHDVTEAHHAQEALRANERRQALLVELGDRFRDLDDPGDISFAAAELLGQALGVSRAGYGTIDPVTETITIERDWNAPGIESLAGVLHFRDYGSYIEDLKRGDTVVFADAEKDLRTAATADALKAISAQAVVNMPVTEYGGFVALLYLNNATARAWPPEELAFIREVAERTRMAVERRRAEQELRESEEHYRHAAELNPQVPWTATPDGQLDRVAARWLDWTGTSGLGESWGEGLHPDDLGYTTEAWVRSVTTGVPYDVEHRVKMLTGEYRWARSRAFPRRDAEGRIVKWYGATEDIHERKCAEHDLHQFNATLEQQVADRTFALRASEARLRAIFETSLQFHGLLTLNGTLVDANATSLEGINASLEEVAGKFFWETPWFTGTPGMPEVVRDAVARAATGNTIRQEILVNLPTGWRWFDFAMRPMRNEQGDIVAIVPEAIETTERHQAEEALRQSQKLEAMGQLTGGVAHDFNNLLTPIIGSLDMLNRRGLGGQREQRLIGAALQSAERAKTLVQRLLAFARRQPLQPTAVDVASLVTGMAELVASTTGPQIKVVVEIQDDLPAAMGDPNQLEMAILNLAVNARDAMPDGGTLRISAISELVAPRHRSKLKAGPYVRLSVADTGAGMDNATLARAIEPFFSTKGVGKGTGLGLSMVHGLASQLGGAMSLSSKLGLGTNVELWLPVSSDPATALPVTGETAPETTAAGTALLVDDEDVVRMSTADMLTELGYEVFEAPSAEEAMRLFNSGIRFDVLITDHLMAGMTGVDLARAIRDRRPDTPVLIVSGYAEAEGVAPDLPRLTKPFRLPELAASIAQLTSDTAVSVRKPHVRLHPRPSESRG